MMRTVWFCSIGILFGSAASSSTNECQTKPLTAAEKKAGWRLLFDGRTEAGWRGYLQTSFPKDGWRIENGCLMLPKGNGRLGEGPGDLVTTEKFENFEFAFQWRISPGGNSGIKYFIKEDQARGGTRASGVGHEYQILDDEKHPDAKNGPTRQAGALYMLVAPNSAKRLRPVGEFNQSRILVKGKHVEHWLNGAKIVEYELESPELMAAIAKSKYRTVPDFGTKFPTQLLLQDHGEEVWFKNMRIRALPSGR